MKKIAVLLAAVIILFSRGINVSAENSASFDDSSVIIMLNPFDHKIKTAALDSGIPDFSSAGIDVTDIEPLMSPPKGRAAAISLNSKPIILKLALADHGSDSVISAVEKLKALPEIKCAEPNYLLELSEANDPYYTSGSQYGLFNVSAPKLWDLNIDCRETCIAFIDSGARVTHEDLVDNIWTNPNEIPGNHKDDDQNGYIDDIHGWNCVNDNSDLSDNVSHGTHVAGILSAATDNAKGVASIARNAKIAVIKAFDSDKTSVDMIIKGISYADTMGFKIVNASFSTSDKDFIETMGSAIEACPDILFVCAAGNNSLNIDVNPTYPASYDFPNIIAVANVSQTDEPAISTNYGRNTVDIAAPGMDIMSSYNTSDSSYGSKSGTSMAAPMTASAAAAVISANPSLSPAEVSEILTRSADHIAALDGKIKNGARLNAYAAAKLVMAAPPSESPEPDKTSAPSDEPSGSPYPSAAPSNIPEPSPFPSSKPSDTPEPSAAPSDPPESSQFPSEEPSGTPVPFGEASPAPSKNPVPKALRISSAAAADNAVNIQLTGNQNNSGIICAAAYDENGAMISFAFDSLEPSDTEPMISIPLNYQGASRISVFVWGNLNEAKPLCEKYNLDM